MDHVPNGDVALLHRQITAIVNSIDPMGLLVNGAPANEYRPKVDDIVPAYLEIGPKMEDLADAVHAIFVRWFAPVTVSKARTRSIATEMCRILPRIRRDHTWQ